MKKIVIIGANSFQMPLIERAKQLNLQTHVFAWNEGAVGAKIADYFYPISVTEKYKILDKCRQIHPSAIATIASDLTLSTASFIAQSMHLPCNSPECIRLCTNKFQMRKALASAGLLTPQFVSVSPGDSLFQVTQLLNYPLIVKPTDRSGSRGITKITTPEQLENAVTLAASQSFEHCAIVEEFIDGEEFSCESISFNGNHQCLALTKKFTTGAPHFIETGHIQPTSLSCKEELYIFLQIKKALSALKIASGASHAEFRLDRHGKVHIIEIGARMGGDCIGSHLVPLSTGQDFLGMVIECSLGQKPMIAEKTQQKAAAIRFVFTQADLEQLNYIKNSFAQSIYYVSELSCIGSRNIVDSSTRLGYYIIHDKTLSKVNQLLRLCV